MLIKSDEPKVENTLEAFVYIHMGTSESEEKSREDSLSHITATFRSTVVQGMLVYLLLGKG